MFEDEPLSDAERSVSTRRARYLTCEEYARGGHQTDIFRYDATVEADRVRIVSLEAQNRNLQEELARLSTRLREEQTCTE